MEYKTIDEICDIFDNLRKPITGKNREKGPFPYYGANGVQDRISSYIFDGTYLLVGEDGTVLTKDNKPVLHYVEGKFWVNNHAHVLKEKENVSLRYVYYALSTIDIKNLVAGLPLKLNQKNLRSIKIPIPPIEKQKEIADLLDKYTKLNDDLIDNLNKEYSLRRKQYEYYKDTLLDFSFEISRINIKEVCDVRDGTHDSPKKANDGKLLITSKNITKGYLDLSGAYYISKDDYNKINLRSKVDKGDILISMIGTIEEILYVKEKPNYAIKNIGLIKPSEKINGKFLYYYLKTSYIKNKFLSSTKKGTQTFLTLSILRSLKIPLPPLEKQQEIVNILEKYERSYNKIKEKILAEIRLREKQYEYYKYLLLKF